MQHGMHSIIIMIISELSIVILGILMSLKVNLSKCMNYEICSSFNIGPKPGATQDSFMYRAQNGVKSVLVDDDNCDCFSTLSMGHGMCRDDFSKTYGPTNRFGVDLLYDSRCQTPDPQHGLSLYFKG